MPHVSVQYTSVTSTGLFEQANPHYGEIWYELGGRRTMLASRRPGTGSIAMMTAAPAMRAPWITD